MSEARDVNSVQLYYPLQLAATTSRYKLQLPATIYN